MKKSYEFSFFFQLSYQSNGWKKEDEESRKSLKE